MSDDFDFDLDDLDLGVEIDGDDDSENEVAVGVVGAADDEDEATDDEDEATDEDEAAGDETGAGDAAAADAAAEARPLVVVADDRRRTSDVISRAEITRAIAIRAAQIAARPTFYIDVGDLSDPIAIAREEFLQRRSPLILEREVGRAARGARVVERWRVREMTFPPHI
jgi:DNA-directed RNA polymerase subunit K/omega